VRQTAVAVKESATALAGPSVCAGGGYVVPSLKVHCGSGDGDAVARVRRRKSGLRDRARRTHGARARTGRSASPGGGGGGGAEVCGSSLFIYTQASAVDEL
jgi:hypothetical protein